MAATKARRKESNPDRPLPVHARRAGAHAISARPAGRPWRVVQRVGARDGTEANRLVAEEAAGGSSGVALAFADATGPLHSTLPPDQAATIAAGLADVTAGFEVRVETQDLTALSAFARPASDGRIRLVRAFDPAVAFASGNASINVAEDVAAAAKALDAAGTPGLATIADGRAWHAGGASDEVELAIVLATFVAHLRVLGGPERIGVALAADTDQFRGIAKFRAIRLLLGRVAEIADLGGVLPPVHGETAWRVMSRRDPRMNVLRATSGAFAAAVGGADSITVLPFDAVGDSADPHARRLARNTQSILMEEAHIDRVADPAAGSGLIEAMTEGLAEAAWKRFQLIEAEGGIVASIGEGSLLREVAEARDARLAAVAKGDLPMVGVNAFTSESARAAEYRRSSAGRESALIFERLAEPFESIAL